MPEKEETEVEISLPDSGKIKCINIAMKMSPEISKDLSTWKNISVPSVM